MLIRKAIYSDHFYISVFAGFVLCCMAAGLETQQFIFLTIPFLTLIFLYIICKPEITVSLLIFTFYLGFPLIHTYMFGIFAADFVFLFLLAAFFSGFLKQEAELSLNSPSSVKKINNIIFIFFIFSFFSVLFNLHLKETRDIAVSVLYMFNMLQLIFVFRIFSVKEIASMREKCVNLVLVFSLIEVIVATIQFCQQGEASVNSLRNVTGTLYSHHAMLGNMMVFPLAFCLYRFGLSGRLARILYFTGALISLFVIVISGSRSTLVGCVFSIVLWLLINFKISLKYIYSIIAILIILIGLFIFTPLNRIILDTIADSSGAKLDLSSIGRILVWKGAIMNFYHAPLLTKFFGIGIGNYYTMKYSFRLIENTNFASGAHNNFLHILIETGIVGLIFFLVLFGVILSSLKRKAAYDNLSYYFFYLTITLLFSGLTQETFWFQPSFCRLWLMYMVFLAFCIAGDKNEQQNIMALK